jgi:hypothetical protein
MDSLERRGDHHRQPGSARTEDRYGTKPGRRSGGSHEPFHAPARSANPDPVDLPAAPLPVGRTDLSLLLGRTVLEARVQRVCKEYGLLPRSGEAVGSGLSRSYLSREAGVELAADAYGVVTTVLLHFHGDDGFTPFRGEIPGGAGSVPRRTRLWAMLGRPEEQGAPYRDRHRSDYGPWDRWARPGFALQARYAVDGEQVELITLTPPDQLPWAA